MPLPPPTDVVERQAAARQTRLRRANRIALLRRQVMAGALSVFVLAFGLVAFDGSMGSGRSSASAASSSSSASSASAVTSQPDDDAAGFAPPADDSGGFDDSGTQGAAPDAIQTSQS